MASYGNFNLNKKRKGKKIVIAVICAALLVAVLFGIGVTVGSENGTGERISSAVAENTQLKLQISELNEQIAQLQEQVSSLQAQLDERPSAEPTHTPAPPAPADEETARRYNSPRDGLR